MIIDLEKCAERPLDVSGQFDLAPRLVDYPELRSLEPLVASFQVAPVGGGRFRVAGEFSASAAAVCVRCLESVAVQLAGRFDLLFFPERERPAVHHGETVLPADQIDVSYYREERLEVLPMLEEQLGLTLPMRFLCQTDCQGLCQHCGANRNRERCDCREARGDPRFEALKALLE